MGRAGYSSLIEQVAWPGVDESALVEDEKLVVVQINGKVRAKITVPATAEQDAVLAKALIEQPAPVQYE